MKNLKKLKGFTLIEVIVVIAIIAILAAMLVPTMTGYIRKARIASAVSAARTIKTSVEHSLVGQYGDYNDDTTLSDALNKWLYLDKGKKEREYVGSFTNKSWYNYKEKKANTSKSQKVDTVIAMGLDETFNEDWQSGDGTNPLGYNRKTSHNCRDYLREHNCNFGLVIVYDADCCVRMMQIYRKGILVTYINGEYVANTRKDARFVGTNPWSTIYTDAGRSTYPEFDNLSIANQQIGDNGSETGWGWY